MRRIRHDDPRRNRPVGRPPKDVGRYHASFSYQAATWTKPRRVVAKVEWHPGEVYPRVGFIVTNLCRRLSGAADAPEPGTGAGPSVGAILPLQDAQKAALPATR